MIGNPDNIIAQQKIEQKEKITRRIVVADDKEDVRKIMSRLLQSGGYDVDMVEDGQQLVDYLKDPSKAPKVDLVVTDNDMPHLTGIEAATQIRQLDGFQDFPIILMSGQGISDEDVVDIKGPKISSFIKPIDRATILRVVREAIEERALSALDMLAGRLEQSGLLQETTILPEVNRIRSSIKGEAPLDRGKLKEDIEEIVSFAEDSLGGITPEFKRDINTLCRFFQIEVKN